MVKSIKYGGPVLVLAAAITLRVDLPLRADAPAATPASGATQTPPAGQVPTPPPGAPADPAARGQRAGGGGRGNAAATLFTASCAGCHGTPGQMGRAPSLFDQKWLDGTTDDKIALAVRQGVPGTEMEGFPDAQLTDQQVFQLIAYIRTATASLVPKPEYLADPEGQVFTSEKQAFKLEVLTREVNTPFGLAFLPDGRLLITERNGALRVLDKGRLSEPVKGTPTPHVQQDGGFLDVTVHPQYARTGWIYLSYAEVRPGFVPPPANPDAAAPPPAAPGPGQGRGRGGPPQPPSNTVIVRGKLNSRNEWTNQQLIFRSPAELYTSRAACISAPGSPGTSRGTSSSPSASAAPCRTPRT